MNYTVGFPAIHLHPINQAATIRLKKEGMEAATFQDLPILALARQVLIKEGQEASEEAIALVASGPSEMEEKTALLSEAMTPEQILTDDLSNLADRILAELGDHDGDDDAYLWDSEEGTPSASDDSECDSSCELKINWTLCAEITEGIRKALRVAEAIQGMSESLQAKINSAKWLVGKLPTLHPDFGFCLSLHGDWGDSSCWFAIALDAEGLRFSEGEHFKEGYGCHNDTRNVFEANPNGISCPDWFDAGEWLSQFHSCIADPSFRLEFDWEPEGSFPTLDGN